MSRSVSPFQQQPVNISPLYLKVSQVAALLSLSVAEVYRLIDSRTLPAIRLGRTLRVSVIALAAFLQERGDMAASPASIQERLGQSASSILEMSAHLIPIAPIETAE